MEETSLKSFSGSAIIVDLRNFSEIARRLLIQDQKPFSNKVKWQIYNIIFEFLSDALDNMLNSSNTALFDYKHTGDGFLFFTRQYRDKKPDAVDSFIFLLNLQMNMEKLVLELNQKIIDLLKGNLKIIQGNRQLRYIKNLFKSESGKGWRRFIDFSIGAHCGIIFYKTYGDKKLFLGNTINQASRFEALSNTFSDYNLFFSEAVATRLEEDINSPHRYSDLSDRWFKNLERIEIKGLGPTKVMTIEKKDVEFVKQELLSNIEIGD